MRSDLEAYLKRILQPLGSDSGKKRYVALCIQEILGTWADEVELGLDPILARQMIELALEDDIIPLIKSGKGTQIVRELSAFAERMRVAHERTERWPDSLEDPEVIQQRERENDVARQIREHNLGVRREVDNRLHRRGPKGGHYTRVIGKR